MPITSLFSPTQGLNFRAYFRGWIGRERNIERRLTLKRNVTRKSNKHNFKSNQMEKKWNKPPDLSTWGYYHRRLKVWRRNQVLDKWGLHSKVWRVSMLRHAKNLLGVTLGLFWRTVPKHGLSVSTARTVISFPKPNVMKNALSELDRSSNKWECVSYSSNEKELGWILSRNETLLFRTHHKAQ